MVKLCLNMIVKNESRIIERLLDSVKSIIDCYCICDTGSTDNTVDLINQYGVNNNIQGVVVHKPFVNFCVNRNFALEEAKKMDCDFILLIDADMKLVINPSFSKDMLKIGQSYSLKQKGYGIEYSNLRIIDSKVKSEYYGVTHEYIGVEKHELLEDIYIDDVGDGGSKGNKAQRDRELLEQGIIDEPNNVRYYFYLANTYMDLRMFDDAIKTYQKRIDMGGWNEEIFYSKYRQGCAYKDLHQYDKMQAVWLDAWQYRPCRIEPMYELLKYYKDLKHYKLADMIYNSVKEDKVPNDVLFVHNDMYDYHIHNEYSLYAFYNGNKDVYLIYDKLFNHNLGDLGLHFNNYKFYYPLVNAKFTIEYNNQIRMVKNGNEYYFNHSTPSIIEYDNQYIMNCRLVNYTVREDGSYFFYHGVTTINKKVVLDKDFNEISTQYIHDKIEYYNCLDHSAKYSGIEDIRIYNYNNEIYYTGVSVNDNIACMIGKYNEDTFTRLRTSNNNLCEKNWVFIPGSLDMIYKWSSPLQIGRIEGDELVIYKDRPMPKIFNMARGSTNGYEYDNKFWFIVHYVHKYEEEKRFYYHSIVCFDKDMNLIKYTYPFKYSKNHSIEYTLGLIVREHDFLITYSKNDATSTLSLFSKDEFKWINQ